MCEQLTMAVIHWINCCPANTQNCAESAICISVSHKCLLNTHAKVSVTASIAQSTHVTRLTVLAKILLCLDCCALTFARTRPTVLQIHSSFNLGTGKNETQTGNEYGLFLHGWCVPIGSRWRRQQSMRECHDVCWMQWWFGQKRQIRRFQLLHWHGLWQSSNFTTQLVW